MRSFSVTLRSAHVGQACRRAAHLLLGVSVVDDVEKAIHGKGLAYFFCKLCASLRGMYFGEVDDGQVRIVHCGRDIIGKTRSVYIFHMREYHAHGFPLSREARHGAGPQGW